MTDRREVLRLVTDAHSPSPGESQPPWPPPDLVKTSLLEALEAHSGLLPDDLELLLRVLPPPGVAYTSGPQLRAAVRALVSEGLIRRIFLGPEPHLVLAVRGPPPLVGAPPSLSPVPPHLQSPQEPAHDRANDTNLGFELQVAVDVEGERLLLFRVLLVLGLIGLLLLLREAALLLAQS